MPFEVTYSLAENMFSGTKEANWNQCLQVAAKRQRRYYDANIPVHLTQIDKQIADAVIKKTWGSL